MKASHRSEARADKIYKQRLSHFEQLMTLTNQETPLETVTKIGDGDTFTQEKLCTELYIFHANTLYKLLLYHEYNLTYNTNLSCQGTAPSLLQTLGTWEFL
jgi:hypothetical protein